MEISLLAFPCQAATPEEQYNAATTCYQSLKNSPERQQYRHNWFNCIQKFAAVYSGYPNHSLASSGMYLAAKLYLGLYRISAIEKDKVEAIDLLNRIIKRYPSSTDKEMAEKLLSSLQSKQEEAPKDNLQNSNKTDSNIPKQNADIPSSDGNAYITDLRYWTTPDYTRIAINVSDKRGYVYQLLDENPSMKQPQRLYLDIKKSIIGKNLPAHTRINDDLLIQARAGQRTDDTVRVVVDIKSFGSYKVFSMSDPFRVIIDVWGDKSERNTESQNGKTKIAESESTKSQSVKTSIAESENASEPKTAIDSKASIKKAESMQDSDATSATDAEVAIKRSTKKSTRTSTVNLSADSTASVDDSSSSAVFSSKSETSSKEPPEIASETNSKGTSHLPVKKSLKASTMILSDATRKLLRASMMKESEESLKDKLQKDSKASPKESDKSASKESEKDEYKETSRTATKGTTRVIQIAPGSNVDRIKASSIAKQLALGVRTIVIDPGHGGRDPGASGRTKGIYEKDIVLSISKKLSQKIKSRLNCNVIMTRSSDTYLTLEERTAIANTKGADLFISLHCNASNDSSLVGIETYYLNLATDERAINVAARENATSRKNISDLESILNDLMKNAKINESSRLSSVVQNSLYRGMAKHYSKIKSLGVKQAPFYVLLGASMPSILIETSFLSNPEECRRLTDSEYQNALCDAITDGIAKYIRETNPQRL